MKKSTTKGQSPKLKIVNKHLAALEAQPLLHARPGSCTAAAVDDRAGLQAVIEDLLGRTSRQFVEQLLVMAARRPHEAVMIDLDHSSSHPSIESQSR